jgi:hypothetical protein
MCANHIGGAILNTVLSGKGANQMDGLNEVISRLKFIGRIQADEKLSTDRIQMQPNSWFTTFLRTLSQRDSRKETFRFLSGTVDSAFELINLHKLSPMPSHQQMCIEVGEDLLNAKSGIRNLMETYKADDKFICDLDVLLSSITRRLSDCGLAIPKKLEEKANF